MVSLNDRKWKEFNFIDLFDIRKGFYNKKPSGSGYGRIPFLGATERNNGITSFHTVDDIKQSSKMGYGKNESIDKKIFSGNCIAVTNDGSVGHAFYQKIPFTCSHSINPLYLINYELNEKISLFLIRMIEMQRVCFQYSRKWRSERMEKSKILLPRNEQGEPDWIFMESYIKQIEEKQKENYKDFAIQKLKNLEYKEIPKLNEKTWKASEIENFFKIYTGGDMIISKLNPGNIPLITHSLSENGVTKYIEEQGSNIKKFNCNMTISLADRGNFGAFVQMIDFYIGTRVKALEFKICDISINKEILMFFSNCINAQATKFNYGNNCCANIGKLKIMLPIKQDETPDYEYMEQYIKNVMYKQLHTYLKTRG